ncbi:NADP-dependent oxidoreductase domain-containing protein [Mycena leptocephala]|nr:NADP-dependent oxidoreductase domain-containing protein [Mycena leptocephala]
MGRQSSGEGRENGGTGVTLAIPLILGAASYGLEGVTSARVTGNATGQQLVDIFLKAGAHIDTKIFPVQSGVHAPENLRRTVKESVDAVCRQINELHKEGLFREFGLSNFHSWELSLFLFQTLTGLWLGRRVLIHRRKERMDSPTVYEGVYNLLKRQAEAELFPSLNKFGIRVYGYSPLAGSILAGKDLDAAGSRFDTKAVDDFNVGQYYAGRYSPLIPAAQELRGAVVKHGSSLPEVAFRWLQHHSELGKISDGDAIIIGSSSVEQLKKNIAWNEEGPLPAEVVELMDDLFARNKGPFYHLRLRRPHLIFAIRFPRSARQLRVSTLLSDKAIHGNDNE